jgi:hydrogenase expression/formation protein HypD
MPKDIKNPGSAFRFRDRALAGKIAGKLKKMALDIRIMHVCGTHQDTLIRHGLDSMFKGAGVEIRQGPGCPVCVTTQREIEECIQLARTGKKVAVFGDMLKVPGVHGSLADWRARGCDIKIVYSINDAVDIARKSSGETVFMGIGFETTAPSTAAILLSDPPPNFSVLCCHRTVPPALKAIVESGEVKLDGLIEPGHVSTIIGASPYEFLSKDYGVPQVIAGFEPLDLLMGVYMLACQIRNGEAKVEIEYSRVVKYGGNPRAVKMMGNVFEPCDVAWRGFPVLPGSGLKLKSGFAPHDARKVYKNELKELDKTDFCEPKGCRCGDVLRGAIYSDECPLFGKACIPENPIGPCMVSSEGSCNIVYKYGK